ncbi:transposable element tc1 protein [Rutstroemia sp. NJR-2017a WRK4]|nr:transposable element tc1 protein [Rutstroemia sp. NJR-2017a WRK4]
MKTAFKRMGYGRRVARRKGYSDDPEVWAERLAFAEWAITWSRERLRCQIFSDEVWAMGGQHTRSYITTRLDGSERLHSSNLDHKYSKQPAWMFHGTIVDGKEGPCCFWEKQWGSMNSITYNRYILSSVQEWIRTHPGRNWYLILISSTCLIHGIGGAKQ